MQNPPENFISLEPAQKKNTTATVERDKKRWQCNLQRVSGCFRVPAVVSRGDFPLGDGNCLPSQGGKIPDTFL